MIQCTRVFTATPGVTCLDRLCSAARARMGLTLSDPGTRDPGFQHHATHGPGTSGARRACPPASNRPRGTEGVRGGAVFEERGCHGASV
jgi:hypothetical protein